MVAPLGLLAFTSDAVSPNAKGFQNYLSDYSDFTNRYNTELPPELENQYKQWIQTLPESQRSTRDYDLRGYFLAGINNEDGIQLYNRGDEQHFIDRFKKPNHPTFSNESKYSGQNGFIGGQWEKLPNGRWSFSPHHSHMTSKEQLADYIRTHEPNTTLFDDRWLELND